MALVVTERCWVICTTISSSNSLESCYQSALSHNKLAKHMKTFSYSDTQSKCAIRKRWCPSSSTTCAALPAVLHHTPVPPEHKLDCRENKQKSSTDFSLFILHNICQSQTGRSGFGFNWDTRSPPEPENHTREKSDFKANKHVFMRY